MADVAAVYGVSPATIQRRLPKIGRRAPRPRERVSPPRPAPATRPVQCVLCNIVLDGEAERCRQLCNYCAQDMGWADV